VGRSIWLALPLLTIATNAPPIRPLIPEKFAEVDVHAGEAPRVWRAEGMAITFSGCVPKAAKSTITTIAVSMRGRGSVGLPIDCDGDGMARIGIGPLIRGQGFGAIVQRWSGGAHCCWRIAVVTREGRRWRRIDLPRQDGEAIVWPKDLTGDGAPDFVLADQSFFYAFDSYAGSWAPPLIKTIRSGQLVDVSTEPAFRPLFAADMAKARKACIAANASSPRGSCAGYLADAARLGRFEAAWAELGRAGLTRNPNFLTLAEISEFLRKHGYLR
jgi:hypothetical protein